VIPLLRDGAVIGVLDIDAPIPARFDAEDRKGIEALAKLWLEASDL
jgi:GAF domain-containing protein